MRILILGKNGMLGHDLEKVFAREDFIALDSNDLDITQKEKVFEKFITLQPDVIINAAAYTNVDLAEQETEKAKTVNGYAVGILAQAAREIGATFVHFSSDYVFDGTRPQGYPEEVSTNPINAYGFSKELGEKLLVEEMESQSEENEPEGYYFLIRTSWLYGQHGKNFVDTMLRVAQEKIVQEGKNATLKVVNDQHGKPTYSFDLAQQVKWLVESHEYPSGIYHITNEEETTWYDFAKEIFRLTKMPIDVVPCSSRDYVRPAKRPHYSALVNTKLPPLRPWKEALAEYVEKVKNQNSTGKSEN